MAGERLIKILGRYTNIVRDTVTGALMSIDTPHNEIHKGETFRCGRVFSAVAASGNADINMTVGAKELHFVMRISTEADTEVFVYEGSAFTTTLGTTVDIFNMNRNSLRAPTAAAYHTPVLATTGTTFDHDIIFGSASGAGPNQSTIGGEIRSGTEVVLAKNTRYLIRATNLLTTTKRIVIKGQWYEE